MLRAGSYCRLGRPLKKIYNPRIQKLGLIVAASWFIFTRTGCRSSATPKFISQAVEAGRKRTHYQGTLRTGGCLLYRDRNLKVPEEFLREADARSIPFCERSL